jgi:hypothetical protein
MRLTLLGIVLIMLIRFGLGLSYSRAIPAWEAYDEPSHFAYAVQLATQGTLPLATDPIPNNERIQPPGYYLLLVAFLKLSASDVSAFRYPDLNPYFYYGVSGRNYAQHPQNPSVADKHIETALAATRIVSLLLTLLGVSFSYRAARLIWPDDQHIGLALAAVAIWALWPQSLFTGAVITNDAPAMTYGALLTWLLLSLNKTLRRGGIGRPSFVIGGLCLLAIALGALIKINLLTFLVPMALLALLSASPRLIIGLGLIGVLATGAALVLLQTLPSVLVPLMVDGQSTFNGVIDHLIHPISRTFMQHTLEYALRSSFGLFGWGNVLIPDALQAGWELMAGIALIGVLWAIIRRNLPIGVRQWATLLTILGGIIGAALALCLYFQSIFLIPGRYLLPALTAFGILLVAGWAALPTTFIRRVMIGGSVIGLLLTGILIPPLLIVPTYFHPPFVTAAEIANPTHTELAPGIILQGFELAPSSIGIYYPGDTITIVLYWSAFHPLLTDYTIHIDVIGPDGKNYGTRDTFPGDGQYPTSYWAVNQPFRDVYQVTIGGNFPAPAAAQFQVSVIPVAPGQTPFQLGRLAIEHP